MATKEEIERASVGDDAFERRFKMKPEDRRPRFTDNGGVEDYVNQMNEDEMIEHKKLLTPASWK
jgi:hypothetical protein